MKKTILSIIMFASALVAVGDFKFPQKKDDFILHLPFSAGKGSSVIESVTKSQIAINKAKWSKAPKDEILIFPQSTKTVKIPDWGKSEFSIELWLKSMSNDCGYAILKKGAFGFPKFCGKNDVRLYINTTDNTSWSPQLKTSGKIGEWQHYVLICDSKRVRVFHNGKNIFYAPRKTIPKFSGNKVFIGSSDGWGKNFKGEIGLLRIYSKALTPQYVLANFKSLSEGVTPRCDNNCIFRLDSGSKPASLDFNGVDSFIKVPFSKESLKPLRSFSAFALVTPRDFKNNQMILSCGKYLQLGLYANGRLFGRLKTSDGVFKVTTSKNTIISKPQWLGIAWDGKYMQLFADGKPVGNLCKATGVLKLPPNKHLSIGAWDGKSYFFDGNIEDVRLSREAFSVNVERTTSKAALNTNGSRFRYPRSRHLKGRKEKRSPVLDFEDLTGWKVITYDNIVDANLYRSQEEPLWGKYVARIDLKKGKYNYPQYNKVILQPPAPVNITKDFDTLDIWTFAPMFNVRNRPTLKLSFQIMDAHGKIHDISMRTRDFGWLHWMGWCIWHKSLKDSIKAPAKLLSMTFSDLNEPQKTVYVDSLYLYSRNKQPLPQCARVPSWQQLKVPNTPDTILPTCNISADKYQNIIIQKGKSYLFSYNGPDQKINYSFTPKSGSLSDITAICNGKKFKPLQGGGWRFESGGKAFPQKGKIVKSQLLSCTLNGRKVKAEWQYKLGDISVKSTWIIEIKGKSLIIDLKADSGNISELSCGMVSGLPDAKVQEVPYLNLSGWRHRSTAPGILNSGELFVSCFLDWYNSEASELFGSRGKEKNGRFVVDLVKGDGKWVFDKQKNKSGNSGVIINGGAVYFPKTNNKRNLPHERIFLTVSDKFAECLPNIPHYPNKWLKETANSVWATRTAYATKLPMMNYYKRELEFWHKMHAYGVKNMNVRLHGNIFRMYTPRRNGDPITFIEDTEPLIGGDKKLRKMFDAMKTLGYRVGLYTDHTLLSPLSYDAWDEDLLTLSSAGQWTYGSGSHLQVKNSRMLELQKKYNRIFREKFAPNCSYLDQITCPPVWRYTDYDSRSPEAGKFSAAYKTFIESLEQEEKDFNGPILSEGSMHWMFAGICDNYAQPQRPDIAVLPDFQLKKLHLLSNDCGYHLSVVERWEPEGVDKLLAYEIAYGNIGHIYGIYHFLAPLKVSAHTLKSYFMIQQLQQYYATIPIKNIKYNSSMGLVPIEKAVKLDELKNNQIHLEYENGLKIFINLNKNRVWEVTINKNIYKLPPFGYVAELPGEILEYSALKNGKRIDFVTGKKYTYCSGNGQQTDFGIIKCSQPYYIKEKQSGISIIPEPFIKTEKIVLDLNKTSTLKNSQKLTVEYNDISGKLLNSLDIIPKNDKITIKTISTAFEYIVKSK